MSYEGPSGPVQADVTPAPPPPPPTISFADIVTATEVVRAQEQSDKVLIDSIGALTFESLRTTLIQWGVAGFPNAYPILSFTLTPPSPCSDGVTRSLTDYISFCSGKSIQEHVGLLQARVQDMSVSYANVNGAVTIVISKST